MRGSAGCAGELGSFVVGGVARPLANHIDATVGLVPRFAPPLDVGRFVDDFVEVDRCCC